MRINPRNGLKGKGKFVKEGWVKGKKQKKSPEIAHGEERKKRRMRLWDVGLGPEAL
jgi:hypothetical protein